MFPPEHIDPTMRILLPVLATEESVNYKIPENFLLSSVQREKKIQYQKILVLQSSIMKMASFIALTVISLLYSFFESIGSLYLPNISV